MSDHHHCDYYHHHYHLYNCCFHNHLWSYHCYHYHYNINIIFMTIIINIIAITTIIIIMVIIIIINNTMVVIWKSVFSWWDKSKLVKLICWLHEYVATYIQNQLHSLLSCWDIRFWQILQCDWWNPFFSIIQKQNWRICNENYKTFYSKLLINWFFFDQVYFFSKN